MPKHFAEQDASSSSKRQKHSAPALERAEEIDSARHLQQLLSFQQDNILQLRNGIRSFKVFLESVAYAEDKSSTVGEQTILNEYLQSQTPRHESDRDTQSLPNIMQAWDFGAQTNNDALLSAIPAVLALLLKTMSTMIDFRNHGIQLCKTVLQTSQLRLVFNGLTAQKHKEHLISPCLRLLTEVVSFDGGTLAQRVFTSKTYTFDGKSLARNLSLWRALSEDPDEDKRRPAPRTNAVRYFLAVIKFLSGPARSEILKYGNVIRALFEHLRHDPVDLLSDTLETLKTCVLLDESIPPSVKSHVLNEHNLGYVAMIYREGPESKTEQRQPDGIAHSFLLVACSDPRVGVLRPYGGWYPPGLDADAIDGEHEGDNAEIDLGLDSIEWYNQFQSSVPVRNASIARFAQTLRPHANALESELLVKIFQAAPELVADYFFKKANFSFDPKLTATWIGYSSFLFSACQLPVPINFGHKDDYGRVPPPVSIVIENILPQPLTKIVLTRCLNQKVEIITFFAVRLICVAFEKLRSLLARFHEAASSEGSLWIDGAARVTDEFISRCPNMKDVIATVHKTKPDNYMQREAVLRLVSLYYEILPQVALEEKFDVSTTLAEALKVAEGESSPELVGEVEPSRLQLLNLKHLLQIAYRTPDMRWWHKPESLRLSPFMTLLKIATNMSRKQIPEDMYRLLDLITKENGILQQETETPALHALISSLVPSGDMLTSDALYEFIEDAFARLVRKPIKYEDDFDSLCADLASKDANKRDFGPVSMLMMVLLEQWPYAAERPESSPFVANWLGRYILTSIEIGEDYEVVGEVYERIKAAIQDELDVQRFISHVPHILQADLANLGTPGKTKLSTSIDNEEGEPSLGRSILDFETFAPPVEDPKHRGLHRWDAKDIPSAVVEGDLAALILSLSSTYREVRQLALANLRQFMKKLNTVTSTYPDSPQIYLLLGLLTNTVSPLIHPPPPMPNGVSSHNDHSLDEINSNNNDTPVPYFCTVYAVLALQILQNPLHPLYAKINDFHTRSPKWTIDRLPSYWTHQILFTPPTPSHDITPTSSSSSAAFATSTLANHHHPSSTSTQIQPSIHQNQDPLLLSSSTPTTPLHFLLSYIYHSLRDTADLAILRKRTTLEPLLSLANNPFLPADLFTLLLRIVARITCLPGGSTMLLTNKGIVAWIGGVAAGIVEARNGAAGGAGGKRDAKPSARARTTGDDIISSRAGLAMLLRRVWETCDRGAVDVWSAGQMEGFIEGVARELDGDGGED